MNELPIQNMEEYGNVLAKIECFCERVLDLK